MLRNCKIYALVFFVVSTGAGNSQAETYRIRPGSTFSYYPSGEGPGIPGCEPSSYQCDFEIAGTLDFNLSATLEFPGTARFTSLDVQLIGNDLVQHTPPPFGLVTTERVEELVLGLNLLQLPTGAPIPSYGDNGVFVSLNFPALTLFGGRDSRPVDGDGFLFDVFADAVPEPSAIGIALVVAAGLAQLTGFTRKASAR